MGASSSSCMVRLCILTAGRAMAMRRPCGELCTSHVLAAPSRQMVWPVVPSCGCCFRTAPGRIEKAKLNTSSVGLSLAIRMLRWIPTATGTRAIAKQRHWKRQLKESMRYWSQNGWRSQQLHLGQVMWWISLHASVSGQGETMNSER